MNVQIWFCEKCRTVGAVDIGKHIDVMSGTNSVLESHRNMKSDCVTFADSIRIVTEIDKAPDWVQNIILLTLRD